MGNFAVGGRSPLGLFRGQPTPRLYDCLLEALRSRHYSSRTEEAYLHWICRLLALRNSTHPRELEGKVLRWFLKHLAISENVNRSGRGSEARLTVCRKPSSARAELGRLAVRLKTGDKFLVYARSGCKHDGLPGSIYAGDLVLG
jgi:hypothetical protein